MSEFTLKDSLRHQEWDLKNWETVLKTEVFANVKKIVLARNEGVTNPYQICRGSDISTIVSNISMGNLDLYIRD
jgi:hypothetical protein